MKRIERLADGVLCGMGGGLAVVLAYLTYRHGVALHYVFLAFVVVGLFGCAAWLNPAMKINLAIVILSTVMSLYAGELFLSVMEGARMDFDATRWLTFPSDFTLESTQARLEQNQRKKPTFDRRSKMEVIEDLAQQGAPAYPAVFPQAMLTQDTGDTRGNARALSIDGIETLPLGGISKVHTVFCNESGEYVSYVSDEHGFHNPSTIWGTHRFDVMAVGDSFTQGSCVPSEANFVSVVRDRHPATVSLGMDSNGPVTMLASLKEYGKQHRPKAVLWFYYEGNDLKDMEWEQSSPLLMRYVDGNFSQGLLDRQVEIDRALIEYVDKARQKRAERVGWEETIKLHHLRQSLALWYSGQRHDPAEKIRSTREYFSSEVSDETFNLFRDVLVDAIGTVESWGGRMYFVYLPEWARYAEPELANKNRGRVLELVKSLRLPLIDIHELFAGHHDPLGLFPFRELNHYNIEGHRLVGTEILRVLSGTHTSFRP